MTLFGDYGFETIILAGCAITAVYLAFMVYRLVQEMRYELRLLREIREFEGQERRKRELEAVDEAAGERNGTH